jgi:hypothetical protein
MKQLFLLLFISLSAPLLNAQSEVEIQLELLTPDLIGKVALDQGALIEWVKLIREDVEAECAKEKGDKDLIVSLTIHSNKDATIELFSLPKMKPSIIKGLQKKLTSHKSPRTKFNEYSLLVVGKINEGAQSDGDFTPALVLPYDRKIAAFQKLSLADKQKDIKNWMQNDVLPVLAHYESNVDSVYLGVKSVGDLVKDKAYLSKSTLEITDLNSDYWRATMEMSKGNQLIPFTKACLLIANGEFDRAQSLLYILRFFYDKTTIPAKLDQEISDKLDLFMTELGKEIEKGIAFHDYQDYEKAIEQYNMLMENFSKSAWLNYEMYYSKSAKSVDSDVTGEEWQSASKIIYDLHPMYSLGVQAKTGKEGYLLFRRREIAELFTDKEKLRVDIVEFADIALDLENYAIAAQIYWLAMTHLSKEDCGDRDLLAYMLYCLHKLGDETTIENFKSDYKKEFAEIEAERLELMHNSLMYKAFKKEE